MSSTAETSAARRIPTFADVLAAAERLAGQAVRTPLVRSDVLDALTGGRVFLKAECLQRTGSFKFRGAFNAISQVPEAMRAKGIVACSSGNHAQGVAEAARLLGFPATILMPSDAPAIKRMRTERSGATVVTYDRATEDREERTAALIAETGAELVHPYDDARVMAGQGTAALEAFEDLAGRGIVPDVVLVCASGGGLTAGTALATEARAPAATIYAVEPDGFDDLGRSLATGERQRNSRTSGSLCDALLTPSPGELTFEINRRLVKAGLAVTDEEALRAVAFAANELKLVVEPGGAVALAALLSGKLDIAGKTVVALLSGGNIEPEIYVRALKG